MTQHLRLHLLLMTALALLLASCATPAESPTDAATTPPAEESPAESPDTSPDGTDEPVREGSARFGRTSMSVAYVPSILAVERMNEMGYDIEVVAFDGNSALIQASVDGLVDINSATVAAQMPAIDAGLDVDFFLTRYLNEFVLVSRSDIESCEQLDGMRVAIHAQTDITGLLTLNWLEENCPEAEPDIQIVSGSENRLAGLLQDQLDASPLDLQDTTLLLQERPDDFHVLANFIEDFPVVGGIYSASPEWLAENEQMTRDFIQAHLDIWQQIYDEPDFLLNEAERLLPEVDPEVLPDIVQRYIDLQIFPLENPLDEEALNFTIDFFAEAGEFQNIGGFDDVADPSYLEAVQGE